MITDPLSHEILIYLEEHGSTQSTNLINSMRHGNGLIYKRIREFEKIGLLSRTVSDDRSVYYSLTGLGISITDKIREIDELMEDV
ncbi:MAG TPA: hypothetical protein VL854_07135 [Nitrososphaeraceae archaeon]|nr:hypothetical protein [Nitrososphaeraceae archaeon]